MDRGTRRAARAGHQLAAALIMMACALLCILAGCSSATPEIGARESVNDYSWEELSAISEEIAAALSDEAALDIARSYHLVNDDGKLDGSQSKEIVLSDGRKANVTIVGFRQDSRADGALTGITFMFEGSIDMRAMNSGTGYGWLDEDDEAYLFGGWATCELRGWLNGDFADMLPVDLSSVIQKVEKTSTAATSEQIGEMDDGTIASSLDSLLEKTEDVLWLPSASEVAGISDDTDASFDYEDVGYRDWLRSEGDQYQLFVDGGVVEEEPSLLLIKKSITQSGEGDACSWWLRSMYDSFYQVAQDGTMDRYENEESPASPGDSRGIVPCFCI